MKQLVGLIDKANLGELILEINLFRPLVRMKGRNGVRKEKLHLVNKHYICYEHFKKKKNCDLARVEF